MLPATKALRKEMLPVAGKPILQYAVEEAAASGIETVVLVTGNHSASLLKHFARDFELEELLEQRGQIKEAELVRHLSELVTFCTVKQDRPLGLGHAISCTSSVIGSETFAVLLPDVIIEGNEPCTLQLIRASLECNASILAVRGLTTDQVRRHGVVSYDQTSLSTSLDCFRITGLVEKPEPERAPSTYGVFGRYVLRAEIFDYIRDMPEHPAEIQLTDALDRMAQDWELFGLLFEGDHYDTGDRMGFLHANLAISLKDPRFRTELRSLLETLIT